METHAFQAEEHLNRSQNNNYSPMWDAHVDQWTAAAVRANKVRRITSFADLTRLVRAGDVESASINPPGPGNGGGAFSALDDGVGVSGRTRPRSRPA